MTPKDLDDFFAVAERVLSERDPALDLPPEDRWMAAVYNKVRKHSTAFRNGVRDTLILLAEYGERLFDNRQGGDSERRVDLLVQSLLAPLSLETLLSHRADLSGYAEAAPDTVLDLLEEDPGRSAAFKFLKPIGRDGIWQDCPRTDLLWALERLAWFPNRLTRVASVLAQLSEQRISDRQMNTPIRSLFSLFRAWMPQTAAPLDERLGTIKHIAKKWPCVSWRIYLGLLPSRHDWLVPNPAPKWRGDKSSAGEAALRRDVSVAVTTAREVLLNWTPQDEKTLGDLVDHFEAFPASAQTRIWDLIDDWTVNASDDAKVFLQDRIRKHYPALDDERSRGALKRLIPTDVVARNRWLFASREPEIGQTTGDLDYSDLDSRIRSLRIAGLREILNDQGLAGLLRLAATCEAPHRVGYLLGSFLDVTDVEDLSGHLLADRDTTGKPYLECLTGLLSTADPGTCKELVQRQRDAGDDSTRLELLLAMPFRSETWRLLDGEDEQLGKSYWQQVEPSRHADSPDELRALIDRLIEAERPAVAFSAVRHRVPDIGTQRILRLLRAIVKHEGEPQPSGSTKDGVARPSNEVAEVIEWVASDTVDRGFGIGAYNARGVTVRSAPGGEQERAMATTYRELAADMIEYPRVRRILEGIARSYEDEAKRWDRNDEVANRLQSPGIAFDA